MCLRVPLPNVKIGDKPTIRVRYTTTSKGGAVQWLQPEQTLGKKHPFLFTQCQVIKFSYSIYQL